VSVYLVQVIDEQTRQCASVLDGAWVLRVGRQCVYRLLTASRWSM